MSNEFDLGALAQQIKNAQDRGQQVSPLSGQLTEFGLSTAYEVAHHIHRARMADGVIPVGRKIGFTNSGIWSKLGIDKPVWGYLYDTTVELLDDVRGSCSLGDLPEPKIEPEMVFRLHDSPSPEMTLHELLDTVDWIAHGYEIVKSSYPDWQFTAADAVADSAFHAKLLIGPTLNVSDLGDEPVTKLGNFSLNLSRDGQHIATGRGADVVGNPLAALRELVRILSWNRDAVQLQAGDIVTTGTITAAYSIAAGETWQTTLDGIPVPGLTVEFLP